MGDSSGPGTASVEVVGLTKHFGHVQAVRGIDFRAEPGRVTGFLGPNGSGKTTTLRMLLGLVAPSAGSATFSGVPYRSLDDPVRRVGVVLEATSFHPARRARSHLKMLAMVSGIAEPRIDEVLELVGLQADARRRVGGFSMGMRQRLELAGALLGDPEVLILDEPGNGLDPQGIAWLREFLRGFAALGRTVLVSSHQLAEMSQTVDDVVIISQGACVARGPLATLMASARPTQVVRTPEPDRLVQVLAQHQIASRRTGPEVVVADGVTPEVLGPLLAQYQVVIYQLTSETSNLEQVFFDLTASIGPSHAAWIPPPPGAPS